MSPPEPRNEPPSRALLALVLLVPTPTLGVLAGMEWWEGTAFGKAMYGLCKVWLLGLPLFWWLFVDKGKWSWSRPRRGGFGVGLLLGVLISVAITVAFLLLRHQIDLDLMRKKGMDIGVGSPLPYLVLTLYVCTVNAVLEEYVWRWFVFRKCEVLLPAWAAVVVSALLFTVHHIFALSAYFPPGLTALSSVGVGVGGIIWSWCYLRYRSIWPGYVSHVIVDITIFAIGWMLIVA